MNPNILNVEKEDAFSSLLELAASNDLESFKKNVERDLSSIDEVGLWYGRQKGSNQMVLQHRTPLMIAATYGSIDVVKLIVSLPGVDVNQSCGNDKTTALHCAASSGSLNAFVIVKLLLASGANPNLSDAGGLCPIDSIVVSPKFQGTKHSLQLLLKTDMISEALEDHCVDLETSPKSPKEKDPWVSEKKEYPIDPSLPDIKNSIYSTDEFRMFSFKVRPCSRAYSHDWTECPFVHPGENARRRDPRKYLYSCVPCPDSRKGPCRRGDMCEYAHGVFECWLHPAQYRTRLCKDRTDCNRRVCFFAHTPEELRPLYVSSPRSAFGSPSSFAIMSPRSAFAPPSSDNGGWPPQQNVPPTLHLPGSNLQSSRLRSSVNARDIPPDDPHFFSDMDIPQHQLLNETSLLSGSSANNTIRSSRLKILTPSNLEEIFNAESSSPRFSEQSAVFSPSHSNQFQQHQQSLLSPIKTSFSPRNVDQSLMQNHPFGVQSPGSVVEPISPMSSCLSRLTQFRSLNSRDLGSGATSATSSLEGNHWSNFGNSSGPPDLAVTSSDDLGKMKRSSSFEALLNDDGDEPDVSWVHSLVRESPQERKEKAAHASGHGTSSAGERADVDPSVLGAWLEQMQLDQLRGSLS